MFRAVDKLRNAVNNLEASLINENAKQTLLEVKEIVELSSHIYEQLKKVDDLVVDTDNKIDSEVFEHASSLDFLYKPTTIENYYEGNYLELFAERRSRELQDSGAMLIHNKFWTANNVIYGNIFGSIPKELITKESVDKLLRYGWETVLVHIYEIKGGMEYTKLYDICKQKFEKYLIVSEKKNNTNLVLVFRV
ncbi:hypothetical protein PV797_06080 [Clostridiaceae bacterium M8S5]|nr:hypothetical protein PV797_06080 [Clostridiaceae bacterium M8S5]